MATIKNPKFCGVELKLIDQSNSSMLFEAMVHGTRVQVYGAGREWFGEIPRLPHVSGCLVTDPSRSKTAALSELLAMLQGLHRATARMLTMTGVQAPFIELRGRHTHKPIVTAKPRAKKSR